MTVGFVSSWGKVSLANSSPTFVADMNLQNQFEGLTPNSLKRETFVASYIRMAIES